RDQGSWDPLGGTKPELVDGREQLGGVAVNTVCARLVKLFLPIAATQQADPEHRRTSRREKVPYGVARDVALLGSDAEPLLTCKKQIRLRLRALHVVAIDDDGVVRQAQHVKGRFRVRPPARSGDGVLDLLRA